MPTTAPARDSLLSRPAVSYAMAVLLPILASFLTLHIRFMHLVPFGFAFLTIVLIASSGGLLPSLLALAFTVVGRTLFPLDDVPVFPLSRLDTARYLFLLGSAVLVSLVGSSRRNAASRLHDALDELQERNAALQQANLDLEQSIADRKLAEAALLRSEKLAAMGRLASTIAHEVNNPLEAITNLLYLARSQDVTSEAAQSYLELAEKEVARVGNVTRLTLGFARNTGVLAHVDVATIVDEVLSILQPRLANKSIEVIRHYQPGVSVTIAPHELRQIATNLVANAIDAAPVTGARLTLTIRREHTEAILLVEDNGTGISATHLQRIFDPFFTTKDEIGTGIGLWVTREIAEKYSGQITAESGELSPDVTTRFRVELPLVTEKASA